MTIGPTNGRDRVGRHRNGYDPSPMARKDRVPNPPKRPQAPQRRSTPADPAAAERQRRMLYLIAGSGVAALAIVLAIVFLAGGGGGDGGERAALEDAGCTLKAFPAQANKSDHSDVPSLTAKPKWNSNPPTSGPHYGQTAVWGFYERGEAVPLVQSTHNLEHGGVVIHYGPEVPDAELDQLRTWYNDDPNGLIVSPLSTNGDKITLSSWTAPDSASGTTDRGQGWLATCTTFDEGAFSAFLDEHRYQGPERIPPELLAPGS
jgi:Protein of unknown function (DUF3105)